MHDWKLGYSFCPLLCNLHIPKDRFNVWLWISLSSKQLLHFDISFIELEGQFCVCKHCADFMACTRDLDSFILLGSIFLAQKTGGHRQKKNNFPFQVRNCIYFFPSAYRASDYFFFHLSWAFSQFLKTIKTDLFWKISIWSTFSVNPDTLTWIRNLTYWKNSAQEK